MPPTTRSKLKTIFLVGWPILCLSAVGAQSQDATVETPNWASEETLPNGDKSITFYIEKPEECTGNGCQSQGGGGAEPGPVSGGSGGGEAGIEAGQPSPLTGAFAASLGSFVNQGLSNVFHTNRSVPNPAQAEAEIQASDDFLQNKYGPTEAGVKDRIENYWSQGHFFSTRQLQSQEKRFQELTSKISDGNFRPTDISSLVQHAPASDGQVKEAVRSQLAPIIPTYARLAQVCGPDGLCDHHFSFNADQYTNNYVTVAEAKEEPQFEKYMEMSENGVDSVYGAVAKRYDDVVGSKGDVVGSKGDLLPTSPGVLNPPGGLLKVLKDLQQNLRQANAKTDTQREAKADGLRVVTEGDLAARRGEAAKAEAAARVAKALLDVAVGLTPIVGFSRDVYEAISGKDALTGETLSDEARLISAVSAMSLGLVNEGRNVESVIEGTANSRVLNKGLSKVESRTADAINEELKLRYGLSEPPYRSGTRVYRYETIGEERFARVYTEGKNAKEGPWLLKSDHIEGLSPEEIASKYSLPSTPTHVSEVVVRPGTVVERGAANKQIFEGDARVSYQYRLLDYSKAEFLEGKPLPKPIP